MCIIVEILKNNNMTLGEKRTRVDFNPGSAGDVNNLKVMGARMIDFIEEYRDIFSQDEERCDTIEIAQRKIEDATMWAVKAVTQ